MYDAAAPPYSNTLQTIDETRGFWIHCTSPATLTFGGSEPTTTDIPLFTSGSGWNLVGYPSSVDRDLPGAIQDNGVGTDFSLVYTKAPDGSWIHFDLTAESYQNTLTTITPDRGYWIKASADNTWQVDYQDP